MQEQVDSLVNFFKAIRVGTRTKAILFYIGLLLVVGGFIAHGILQEIKDYHPKKISSANGTSASSTQSVQAATATAVLKAATASGTAKTAPTTPAITRPESNTASIFPTQSTSFKNPTSPTASQTGASSSATHAIVQSAIEENPALPVTILTKGLVDLGK